MDNCQGTNRAIRQAKANYRRLIKLRVDNYVFRKTTIPAPTRRIKKNPTRTVVSVVPLMGKESVNGVGEGVLDGLMVTVGVGFEVG